MTRNFDKIISSDIEHESIINSSNISKVMVTSEGYIDLSHLEHIVRNIKAKHITLISIMLLTLRQVFCSLWMKLQR